MANIGKMKVVKVGEKQGSGCKGVINGIPIGVKMGELVEHLRVRHRNVVSTIRMTRGAERVETELVLVEFKGEELPREVFFGFIRY